MDFNKFDSVSASNQGRNLQLKHPATGKPIFDPETKKPCIVTVLGSESDAVQKSLKQRRAELSGRKNKKIEETDVDELIEDFIESAIPLIVGFQNVHKGDQPATVEDVNWFLRLQRPTFKEGEQSFAEQVLEFAASRANFLGQRIN